MRIIHTEWPTIFDIAKSRPQQVDPINQEMIIPPLSQINREEPSWAWDIKAALAHHQLFCLYINSDERCASCLSASYDPTLKI